MKEIEKLITDLQLDSQLKIDEIPDLDLYMDQVIQIFENKFDITKRNEKDKVLTKTMINNYAKGKLFFPIGNKKYTKKHLILISFIYQLKGALSLSDIKETLRKLNQKIVTEDFPVEEIYQSYLNLSENNMERFVEDVNQSSEEVIQEVLELNDGDSDYLEQLLLIATLANMSNSYRRLAERLVDRLPMQMEEKKTHSKEEGDKN